MNKRLTINSYTDTSTSSTAAGKPACMGVVDRRFHQFAAPGKPVKFVGETYTLAEIAKISEVLKKTNQVAYAAVSLAAFAGFLTHYGKADMQDLVTDKRHLFPTVCKSPESIRVSQSKEK
jgi:hypothetical protein